MSLTLQFILLLYSFASGLNLDGHKCQRSLEILFDKHGVVKNWQQSAPLHPDTDLYRSETKTFGTWVDLELRSKTISRLRVLSQNATLHYFFNEECSFTTLDKKHSQKFGSDDFTDEKLHRIVQGQKGAMIYLWSPRMVYSVKESGIFKKVADQLNLEFVSVVDANVGAEFLAKTVDLKLYPYLKAQKNRSLELLMRGATVHYPSVLISNNQNLSKTPIVGVYNSDLLKAKIYKQMDPFK